MCTIDVTEQVVSLIRDYKPMETWMGYTQRETSYINWAKKELIERLVNNAELPPLLVVEDFEKKMLAYYSLHHYEAFWFAYILSENIVKNMTT